MPECLTANYIQFVNSNRIKTRRRPKPSWKYPNLNNNKSLKESTSNFHFKRNQGDGGRQKQEAQKGEEGEH